MYEYFHSPSPNFFLLKKACKRASLRWVCISESGEIAGLLSKRPVAIEGEGVLKGILKSLGRGKLFEREKKRKEKRGNLKFFNGLKISLVYIRAA